MNMKALLSTLVITLGGITTNCFAQAPLTIGASDGPVTIVNVEVNKIHGNQAHISPGATFTLRFDFNIFDTTCPSCIDQIQIGFANALPTECAFYGVEGAGGVTESSPQLQLTAPTANGIYYVAFDRSQAYNCPTTGWWNGTPQDNQYIAAIAVY